MVIIKNVNKVAEEILKTSLQNYMIFKLSVKTGLQVKDILTLTKDEVILENYEAWEGENLKRYSIRTLSCLKCKLITVKCYLSLINDLDFYFTIKEFKPSDYLFSCLDNWNSKKDLEIFWNYMKNISKILEIETITQETINKTFVYNYYKKWNNEKHIAYILDMPSLDYFWNIIEEVENENI